MESPGSSAAGSPKGSVMTITFQLHGQEFMALNGGPHFKFTPAISLMVDCEAQAEIDEYWEKLSAGGSTQPCGWLTDRFGVSWQIVPTALAEMMQDDQAKKSERVMKAILEMEKLDLPTFEKAYAGK
jgi:predicted 3-demethylubiquinone-9 3-methyltransferase (glyoxalase superfamily)